MYKKKWYGELRGFFFLKKIRAASSQISLRVKAKGRPCFYYCSSTSLLRRSLSHSRLYPQFKYMTFTYSQSLNFNVTTKETWFVSRYHREKLAIKLKKKRRSLQWLIKLKVVKEKRSEFSININYRLRVKD